MPHATKQQEDPGLIYSRCAMWYIIFAAVILLIVVLAVVVLALRRPPRAAQAPAIPAASAEDELAERRARRRSLQGQEDELLSRRVHLDQRRGTLGGDTQLYDALDHLEQQFEAGDISEDEFESEKVRLLGG